MIYRKVLWRQLLDYFEPKVDELRTLGHNKILLSVLLTLASCLRKLLLTMELQVPIYASGVNWDLRKDNPYSVYSKLDFNVPIGKGIKGTVGDSWIDSMLGSRNKRKCGNCPTGYYHY